MLFSTLLQIEMESSSTLISFMIKNFHEIAQCQDHSNTSVHQLYRKIDTDLLLIILNEK